MKPKNKSPRNYRVVKHSDGTYDIHEVYYDDRGRATRMSEGPVIPYGESVNALWSLLAAMISTTFKPVFIPPKKWGVK